MPDFSIRSSEIEIMDDLSAKGPIIDVTLRELETINHLLGGNAVTIDAVHQLLEYKERRDVHIVDAGCGSGDIIRLLAKKLSKTFPQARFTGVDANPNIAAYAAAHTPPSVN